MATRRTRGQSAPSAADADESTYRSAAARSSAAVPASSVTVAPTLAWASKK